MKLYLLEWDNGHDFDDHQVTTLGVYGSEQTREEAKHRWAEKRAGERLGPETGDFEESEIEVDRDLF